MLYDNLQNKNGVLYVGGRSVAEIAAKYGTPLMITDGDKLSANCRRYTEAIARYFDGNGMALYAGKALCVKGLYARIRDEGLGADAVSLGELQTMTAAGFPMERVCFHGNAKTDESLRYAVANGVGHVVVDNSDELKALQDIAKKQNKKQAILLRVSPGIDPHTFEAVKTGKVDSKFGSAIATGQAMDITRAALGCENIVLDGFHCHIGSQIFESKPFVDAAHVMIAYIAEVTRTTGLAVNILDIGGGIGVPYVDSDPVADVDGILREIACAVKADCAKAGIKAPTMYFEPGRSIVADTTLTVYTVQSFKEITGYKNYVAINGGMPDNPRYALYRSAYTCLAAERLNDECDLVCTVAGCCCESGDLIQENVRLPRMRRGELLAVLGTGAYNYAMSSNYNVIPRPPIVILDGGADSVLVRRETIQDILDLQN